ncbi:N-acetylglucosamine-6-phosphate deacetylase [Nakamurella endophytica]|uniref:N-acetylglucosamine-6-phosphate deacetylase n=1 Tax=Nakamurella endophytica TaxID=1748367 RepID=A0A917STG6_9ACTN|nr:N-acetylglucosamine-6-phosphate deacetylase [Nakamurella endophytica]GGL98186.1 N-acetylglucosamine-6-phosphate deacetylase [Nakamurella endophytica]
MADLRVLAGDLVVDGRATGPSVVEVTAGRISAIVPGGRAGPGPVLDARDATVAAGFVDLHTHGAAGAQVIDGRADDVSRMARFYAAHGVTGFLATVGGSDEHIEAGLSAVRAYLDRPDPSGARCLGVHLEGPFISGSCPGAFRPDSVVPADAAVLARYLDRAGGTLRLLTLAPELPGADELLGLAAAHGVVCSAGHSAASAADMTRAVDLGVRGATHLFNAMAPLHHRRPGILGVALTDPRVVTEVIADGVHVDPLLLRLTARAKGLDGMVLITDSIGATGLPDGVHHFEEQEIVVDGGAARLADGTLAGSVLDMATAVANFAAAAGVSWERATIPATRVPARVLGLGRETGTVAVGLAADLVAVDAAHRVLWTLVGGRVVHRR